jgi:RNA polymerase sigma-70 factor (ECF subfamily)
VRYLDYPSMDLIKVCAQSNDYGAWEEFLRRFHSVIGSAVLRTARMWVEPTSPQLDDLIQETYLKVCQNDCQLLRAFRPRHENSIYGFLKVVAANVVHDHFKASVALKRGSEMVVQATIETQSPTVVDDDFNKVSQRLQIEQIDKILRQTSTGPYQERNRAIFWLRHRQGFTAREIAALPSIELTTEGVESVLLRLSTTIRTHLSGSQMHREVKVLKRKNRSGN